MTRTVTIGAAQVGPIQLADTRSAVVDRLISLLRQGADAECAPVSYTHLTLPTINSV